MKKIQTRVKAIGKQDSMAHDSIERQRQIVEVVEHRATRQQIAMDTHYEHFFFYKRHDDSQETCPCWRDTDPDAGCTICHGMGKLPPFSKLGYTTDFLVHANSVANTLNLKVNYNSEEAPPLWELPTTALNGRIESSWIAVMPNSSEDILVWADIVEEELKYLTIEFSDDGVSWQSINDLKDLLATIPRYKIRATISRDDLDEKTPGLGAVMVRYRNKGFEDLRCTQPQWAISTERNVAGLLDLIDNGIFVATGVVSEVEVGDFFEHVESGTRFRVMSIENQIWKNERMEWTLQTRKILPGELLDQIK